MTARTCHQVGTLLRLVGELLEISTESEIIGLLDGSNRLTIVRLEDGVEKKRLAPAVDLNAVVATLQSCETREDALRLVKTERLLKTKAQLLRLAKTLSVHVDKQDSRHVLEERIVEAVIGVRLRSAAIRGETEGG